MPDDQENIYFMLGRIESKLDHALARTIANETAITAHDDRITKIEHRQSWMMGVAAAVAAFISYAVQFLLNKSS